MLFSEAESGYWLKTEMLDMDCKLQFGSQMQFLYAIPSPGEFCSFSALVPLLSAAW